MANLASALVADSLADLAEDRDGDSLLAQNQNGDSLLAAFFCTDTDASSTDCKVMTLNLMGELCRVSNDFSSAVAQFLNDNPEFLRNEPWNIIFGKIRTFLPDHLDQCFIVVIDANGSYADISDMLHEWRKYLPSSIRMLLSNGTEDEYLGKLKTVCIEVPPEEVKADIIRYAEKFLSCFGPDDDKFSLKEAAKKLGDLSKGNFSVVVLAERLIKLRGEPPTMDLLDALEPAGPEHLLYFILREYRHIESTNYDLLVRVLLALARPRTFAPTVAMLAEEVREGDKTKVGRVVRQLGPLVTVHRPASGTRAAADVVLTGAAAPEPARVVLFSSLMAWSVDRLDREVGLYNVGLDHRLQEIDD
ncbi:hypothetical protein HK405_007639 [Cladochytrium tenue]|nr:hypothetical protein HK405_007639 [Cladochytrium tenue]